MNSLLREDHFLLQATFGLRCPSLLEWSCCFFIVSKLFECRHWRQFSFTLSWGEIAYIWPREVFLLSFNFRTIYIHLMLKEIIFCITTVPLAHCWRWRKHLTLLRQTFSHFLYFVHLLCLDKRDLKAKRKLPKILANIVSKTVNEFFASHIGFSICQDRSLLYQCALHIVDVGAHFHFKYFFGHFFEFNISLDPFCPVLPIWKLTHFYWNQVQLFFYFVCMWDETWVSDFRSNGGRGEGTVKVCEGWQGMKKLFRSPKKSKLVENCLHISKADNTLLYTLCWSQFL